MNHSFFKRTALLVATAATTTALVASGVSAADAATIQRGNSDTTRSVSDGTGNASASSRATDAGFLRVETTARGGNGTPGPIIGGSTTAPTTARSTAVVRSRVAAASGTYRVVVRYQGLSGREVDRGPDATARAVRTSRVTFVSRTGGQPRTVRRVQEVPQQRGNRNSVILISIPRGQSGFLRVSGELSGRSQAEGARSGAEANAQVRDVDFVVNRVR